MGQVTYQCPDCKGNKFEHIFDHEEDATPPSVPPHIPVRRKMLHYIAKCQTCGYEIHYTREVKG